MVNTAYNRKPLQLNITEAPQSQDRKSCGLPLNQYSIPDPLLGRHKNWISFPIERVKGPSDVFRAISAPIIVGKAYSHGSRLAIQGSVSRMSQPVLT